MINSPKRPSFAASLSFALLLLAAAKVITGRDISAITYHFTTCGNQGRLGPSLEQCQNHYQSTNSIVSEILMGHTGYLGGQQFKFPRSGYYDIFIAGASGGRGVCSIEGGKGVVLSTQLYIEQDVNDTFLILVGQRGTSPCDTNPNYSLCSNPPINLTEANSCNDTWEQLADTGGGGGGGGSMLWAPNAQSNYTDEILPVIAASGGGGTSVVLNYTSILHTNIPIGNLTDREYYINWINGQPVIVDALNGESFSGSVGNQPLNGIAAGYGAGWRIPENLSITFDIEDGSLISQNENFSIGGQNCLPEATDPFVNVTGGFGGGGGGCSEGGGGGGYGGGWVLMDRDDIPGRGGYSIFTGLDVTVMEPNNGNGYVKIIPLDCGCSSGECNIVNDTFSCVCREGDELANNNVTCFKAVGLGPENVTTEETDKLIISDRNFQAILTSFEYTYRIFRVTFKLDKSSVSKREVGGDKGTPCIVAFIDTNETIILISTIDLDNGLSEGLITITNDTFSSPMEFFEEGHIIAAIMSLGGVNCKITDIVLSIDTEFTSNTVSFNISIDSLQTNNLNILDRIGNKYLFPETTSSISSTTSQPSPTPSSSYVASSTISISTSMDSSPTATADTASSPIDTTIIAIISVVSVLAVVLVLAIVCLIAVVLCRRMKSKRKTTIYQIHSKTSNNGGPLQRRGTLQRIKTRIMSLTSNPNYGETNFPNFNAQGDEFIDLGPKQVGEDSPEKINPYESVNLSNSGSLSNSMKRSSGLRHMSSKKDSSTTIGGPFRLRSRSKRRTYTLKPKYGVMAPTVDFYEYNSKRSADDSWEYDRTQLTYLRDIGEGQFGKVLLMKAKNIGGFNNKLPVAVKTLSSIEEEDITKFLEEVELMKKFCHPNIVSLLGVNSGEGAPLMILEYMPYGDLQSFLKRHKPKGSDSTLIGAYHHKKFARDVVLALNFLSTNKYVHRDVAARNCLVGPSLDVKLADFGMARGVHEKEYYRIAGRAILPVRWMAPESLLYGMFSSSSDVWSYGVLLWEIVTYGDMPLEPLSPQNIVDMAQMQTLRHDWPVNSTQEELMDIKDQCHVYEHEERITFDKIIELLPYSTDTQAGTS